MLEKSSHRHLLAGLAPLVAFGVALAFELSGTVSPWAALREAPWLALGLTMAALAAALHRPLGGGSLGLGAAAIPLTASLYGNAAAALCAVTAAVGAGLAWRRLGQVGSYPRSERRSWRRALEGGAAVGLAVLAALALTRRSGLAPDRALAETGLYDMAALSGAAYLLLLAALRYLDQKLRRPSSRVEIQSLLLPLVVDLAGWSAGVAIAVVASRAGVGVAGLVLALLTLLSLEAARNALLRDLSEQRIYDLEQVSRAGQRMIAISRGLGVLAESVRSECRKVLPFLWFHFELDDESTVSRSWFAGPSGILAEGQPAPEANPPTLPGFHKRTNWRILDYPLQAAEGRLGRLRLWCDPRRIETTQVALLERLVPQIAASVHRSLLDRQAKRDPLTGLAGRRVLMDQLDAAFERCLDDGSSMAVIMCDLDHFKKINDTHGHNAGDQALVAAARVLAAAAGSQALCCRYGGEEFTVLLDQADGETALELAERLRSQVEALDLVVEGSRIPLALSAGVAAFPELHIKTAGELLLLADNALYEAKRNGRNRCFLDLGHGRFLTAHGETLVSEDALSRLRVPRFFA